MQAFKVTVFLGLLALSAFPGEFTPELSEKQVAEINAVLQSKPFDLETAEKNYQSLIQEQSLADLMEVYKPENQAKLKITYASFTPVNTSGGGSDLGFGLHIVKRLELKLPSGKTKTIDVNELWDEEKKTGGLFLPDEIRLKSQAVDGPRFVPGSEKNYLFDQFRVAWGVEKNDIQILRRTKYTFQNGKNEVKAMRVPVSAPFSCRGCHRPTSSLANEFLKEGETRNYEAIVQDSHFALPPEEMRGFKQYVAYLQSSHRSAKFIERAAAKLKDIRRASELPGFYEALQKSFNAKERSWMIEDSKAIEPAYLVKDRQGVYEGDNGSLMTDAIEDSFEGKYRWWEPQVFIP